MLLTYERFGTLTLPIYDPSEPIGSFPSRLSYADLPGGGAFRAYGNAQAPAASRTLRRSGMLLAETLDALDTALAALVAKRGKVDRLYGRWPNGDLVWTMAELADVAAVREPRTLFRFTQYVALDVETEFVLFAPPWYGDEHGEGWTFDSGKYFDTGLVFDQALGDTFTLLGGVTNVNTITNGGNATVRNVTYTLTAPIGGDIVPSAPGLSSVTINTVPADISQASQLQYFNTIAAGDSLIIEAGRQAIYNNSTPDYANLDFGSGHVIGGWIELGPGENSLQVFYTGPDGATLLCTYSDGWE